MGSSPESDFSIPVNQQESHSSPWSIADLFKGARSTPALDTSSSNESSLSNPGSSKQEVSGLNSILGNFSLGSHDGHPSPRSSDLQTPTSDNQAKAGDAALSGSLGDNLSGIIAKVGEFLKSVLPPEYAQYVQQYLPMAEQFISKLLKDVKTGDGPNGSKHMEAELNEPQSIPDVLPDTSLEVDSKLGFDTKWDGSGLELSNIQGLHLKGQTNGDVRSGRLDINDGNPTLTTTVQGADGQTNEVQIPLPDISNLLSQIGQGDE